MRWPNSYYILLLFQIFLTISFQVLSIRLYLSQSLPWVTLCTENPELHILTSDPWVPHPWILQDTHDPSCKSPNLPSEQCPSEIILSTSLLLGRSILPKKPCEHLPFLLLGLLSSLALPANASTGLAHLPTFRSQEDVFSWVPYIWIRRAEGSTGHPQGLLTEPSSLPNRTYWRLTEPLAFSSAAKGSPVPSN